MTIQTLFDAWQATKIDPSVNPPATEAEIQVAEKKSARRCLNLDVKSISYSMETGGGSVTHSEFEPTQLAQRAAGNMGGSYRAKLMSLASYASDYFPPSP